MISKKALRDKLNTVSLSLEEFNYGDLENVLLSDDGSVYNSKYNYWYDTPLMSCGMYQKLLNAAQVAFANNNLNLSKIFLLLSDCCLIDFDHSKDSTFKIIENKSMLLSGNTEQNYDYLKEMLPKIKNTKMRARIADLVWDKMKDYKFSIHAIEDYSKLPLSSDSWLYSDGKDCLIRLLSLCSKIKYTNQNSIENNVIEYIKNCKKEDDFMLFEMSTLLYENNYIRPKWPEVVTKLKDIINELEDGPMESLYKSDLLNIIIKLSSLQYDPLHEDNVMIWIDAVKRLCDNKDYKSARTWHYKARILSRNIPKDDRTMIDNKLNILKKEIDKNISLLNLNTTTQSVPPEDIKLEQVNTSNEIKDYDLIETLEYAISKSIIDLNAISNFVINASNNSVTNQIAGQIGFTKDGRVRSTGNDSVMDNKINYYNCRIGLFHGIIMIPCLEKIKNFEITEEVVASLINETAVIPPDRDKLIIHALLLGFQGDFVSSAHVGIPQIENWVRCELKKICPTLTTTFTEDKEDEKGLSALIKTSEVKDKFGDELVFQIDSLLCNSAGMNLRNNIAHGLLDYSELMQPCIAYSWLLLLRMVMSNDLPFQVDSRKLNIKERLDSI